MARFFTRGAGRLAWLAPLLISACSSPMPITTARGDAHPTVPITAELVQSQAAARQALPPLPPSLTAQAAQPYTVGPGDILSITVWDHPELQPGPNHDMPVAPAAAGVSTPAPGFTVDTNGHLAFPYAGTIPVAGLRPQAVAAALARALAPVLRNPRVTVRVQAYRSQRVYVDGQVRAPGLQTIDDVPMTVQEALQRAGGLLPEADASRLVLERGGARFGLDLARNASAGQLMLLNGDVVHIPPREDNRVFVAGEVLAPRALNMRAGRLTLNEALGEVGGVNPQTGDASQVYVVRQESTGPRVYQLDARAAESLALAEQFELSARDVVYVAASPLANWHRTISLLFPGALSAAVSASKP